MGQTNTHTVTYLNNPDGEVLYRSDSAGPLQEYYYVGAQQIGETTDTGPLTIDYAQAINEQYQAASPGASANFDENYTPISPTSTGDAGQTYIIQSGDTLQSIAKAEWGDADLWYVIADANGLDAGQTLVAGVALTIPNVVVNIGHASGDSIPYNANQATGYIDPTVPPPPTHNGGGCGGIGAIIVAIMALAVQAIPGLNVVVDTIGATIGGAASGAIGGALGTIIGGAVTVGVEGSLADAIGQGVAVAVGAQSSFNWAQVGMAGIASFVGGGGPVGNLGSNQIATIASTVVTDAASSAIAQGIGVATGLQKSFSWAGVAAAGIEGGVTAAVAPAVATLFPGENPNPQGYFTDRSFAAFGANALTGAAALIAGAATRSAITGQGLGQSLQDDLPNFVAQTVGNLVGAEQEQAQQDAAQQEALGQQEQAELNAGLQRGADAYFASDPGGVMAGFSDYVQSLNESLDQAEAEINTPAADPASGSSGDPIGDLIDQLTGDGGANAFKGEPGAPFSSGPHMQPNQIRSLTAGETLALQLNTQLTPAQLAGITVQYGGEAPGAAATTIETTIHLDPSYALDDFPQSPATMSLLVHESEHVYQFDSNPIGYAWGVATTEPASAIGIDVYSYTSSNLGIGQSFSNLNIGQQAQIVEDLYRINNNLSPLGASGFTPTSSQLQLFIFGTPPSSASRG